MSSINESLFSIYSKDHPDFLKPFYDAQELKRIDNVGMNCGLEYTSFPIYKDLPTYSRYQHSIGVALIVWHFTKNEMMSLAGLFHDIATPAFSHVIDFVYHDYQNQEATEHKTKEIIASSKVIMDELKKMKISLEEVCDYHLYPIADNPKPQLSADRLEYTLGSFLSFNICTKNDIEKYYQDLYVGKNEEGIDELSFKHLEIAKQFTLNALKNFIYFAKEEDRFAMEYLASIIREAIKEKIIDEEDLYVDDKYVINKLENSILLDRWNSFKSLHQLEFSNYQIDDSWIQVATKKRYIDPLVNGTRISKLDQEVKERIDAFLNDKLDIWMKAI